MKRILALLTALILIAQPALAADFTDALGRTVSIENPQRVVALYSSYGDAWLEAGGQLVGTIADAFGEEDPDIQYLGSHITPNMELLFSLEPDFVLLSATVSTHPEIGATLEQAGIPCAFFNTTDWHGYMDCIALFSGITGRRDLYEKQQTAVQQPIETLIAEAQADESHYQKTTALLLRANSVGVKAKDGSSTIAGNILSDMGFINIADSDSLLRENLSMESILIADPDYIFLLTSGSDTEAAMASLRASLSGNPAWGTLTAVREGRFITLDRELFLYHPNSRWAESYAFIADLLKGENPQ